MNESQFYKPTDKMIVMIREDIADIVENMKAGNTRVEMIAYINENWSEENA